MHSYIYICFIDIFALIIARCIDIYIYKYILYDRRNFQQHFAAGKDPHLARLAGRRKHSGQFCYWDREIVKKRFAKGEGGAQYALRCT